MKTEQNIRDICQVIKKSDLIGYGECFLVTSMLMKYFLDYCNNIYEEDIKIHYGFIGAELEKDEHVVITPHMWLSYKNKKIDLTADMQKSDDNCDLSSSAYILDIPVKVLTTRTYVKPLSELNETIYGEKSEIFFQKTEWNKKCYEIAEKDVNSCITQGLLEKFIVEGDEYSKEVWGNKFEIFKKLVFTNQFNILKDLIHEYTNEILDFKIDIKTDHMSINIIGNEGFKLVFSSNYTQYINVSELEFKNMDRGKGYGTKVIEWLIGYVKEFNLCMITICQIISPHMLSITERLGFDLYKNDCVMNKFIECSNVNGFDGFYGEITPVLKKLKDKRIET